MVLIGSPDEGPILGKIDLHDAEAWYVAGTMIQSDPRAKINLCVSEGFPVQRIIQPEVVAAALKSAPRMRPRLLSVI